MATSPLHATAGVVPGLDRSGIARGRSMLWVVATAALLVSVVPDPTAAATGTELPQDDWHTQVTVLPGRSAAFSEEDRRWWAFQPLQPVEPPHPTGPWQDWIRTSIDSFIADRLQQADLQPSPEPSREILLRRLSLDLLGMPPSDAERERFLNDTSPDAYERLVDRLLASPHYGERQARFWLDLVRYAESDGYRVDDYRPDAWRYRDWVIEAWNEDMPYDEFVQAQLAGDELWPGDPARARVATAFLRHWIYEYNNRDVRGQWETILNDLTDVTGDVFLGLGIQCARCHDHKFDPILQKDYFRLQAFFAPILPREDLVVASAGERADHEARMAVWETATRELRDALETLEAKYREQAGLVAIEKFTEDLQALLEVPKAERTPKEHQIAELAYRQVEYEHRRMHGRIQGADKEKREMLLKQLQEFSALKPQPLPVAFTVTDVGTEAPPTVMKSRRGEITVEPGFLSLLDEEPAAVERIPGLRSTGRRATLAKWLTRPENPLTARVLVNRIWQQHFGLGLVATPSDFGRLGEPPSHPELLDWLTARFIANGWRIKPLHREILLSSTYRQGPPISPAMPAAGSGESAVQRGHRVDPLNRLLWHFPTRRLDAEQIRDSLLAVSGELQPSLSGPSVPATQPRRSIYTRATRNVRDPLLDSFDAAESFVSSSERNVTTTPTQSLLMINSQMLLERAQVFSERLLAFDIPLLPQTQEPETSDGELAPENLPLEERLVRHRIHQAYQWAYGRSPSAAEVRLATTFLREQTRRLESMDDPAWTFLREPMPYHGGSAAVLRPGSQQDHLRVSLSAETDVSAAGPEFTIEGFALLRRAPDAQGIRVLASLETQDESPVQWTFGIAGARVSGQPLTVVLQLGTGETQQIVSSGLTLELNRPYYLAASVSDQVVFTVKDAANDCEPPLVVPARLKHPWKLVHARPRESEISQPTSTGESPVLFEALKPLNTFFMGRSRALQSQPWDGLISEIRLTASALPEDQLLLTDRSQPGARCLGWWRFSHIEDPFRDFSTANHAIVPPPLPEGDRDRYSPQRQAWMDFCHVLLNSNEFLYLD